MNWKKPWLYFLSLFSLLFYAFLLLIRKNNSLQGQLGEQKANTQDAALGQQQKDLAAQVVSQEQKLNTSPPAPKDLSNDEISKYWNK